MGLGLFFWWARWPGGAGFAGTADIFLFYRLKSGRVVPPGGPCEMAARVLLLENFVYLACGVAKQLHLSKHETSGRPACYAEEQLRLLVLPMEQREGVCAARATLPSFLARIAGQKNAISTAGEAVAGSHELDKVSARKIPVLVSYITLGVALSLSLLGRLLAGAS